MLENIKLMLGLEDDNTKFDKMISLYISKITSAILDYCNISELNKTLESFIEDKVYVLMNPKIKGGTQNTGEVKAVTRGDTKIDYNVASTTSTTQVSKDTSLTDADRNTLNQFRKLRFR